jgi:hypothetical protein
MKIDGIYGITMFGPGVSLRIPMISKRDATIPRIFGILEER